MKYLSLVFLLPVLAFAAEPNRRPAVAPNTATGSPTLQTLDKTRQALNIVSQAATECYGLAVSNPNGRAYQFSDSMVNGLSCGGLSADTVLSKLSGSAFSPEKHMPVVNWPSNGIANCWALALAQRQVFYLTRFGATKNSAGLVNKIVGMAGGSMPSTVSNIAQAGMDGTAFRSAQANGAFRAQIERRQSQKFYSAGNLGFIMGSRERSESTNQETIQQIISGVQRGRMPALILRAKMTAQHVVLVKKVERTGTDSFRLTVYDSNQPMSYFGGNFVEPTIEFRNGQFFSPSVVGRFHEDGYNPVGVFITDEEEMDQIQNVAYNHYADLCKKVKALEKLEKTL